MTSYAIYSNEKTSHLTLLSQKVINIGRSHFAICTLKIFHVVSKTRLKKKRQKHGGTLRHVSHLPYNVFPGHAVCGNLY
jgi:hypothetical protein